MTDRPIDPNDPNATARYDAPPDAVTTPPPATPTAPPPVAPPPSGWSNPAPPAAPAWRPPVADSSSFNVGSIAVGLVLLAIGLWFFADQTLGFDMPRIRWSQLWPVFIILIGLWIAVGSFRRRSR